MCKSIVNFAMLAMAAQLAFAWGNEGHMMVAAVAWEKLTPAVKTEVSRLLKLNPQYDSWTDGVSAADKDEVAFIMAATWPDFIKSQEGYTDDGEHPTSPDAAQNIGYADKTQHRYWHFYDTPFSPDETPTKGPDAVNALTQIRMFVKALKTSKDDSVLSYDVVWLEHMVGDVHQPLHATSRFDVDDPAGDEGANRVHLCSANQTDPSKCKADLHAFWDDAPGTKKDPEAAKQKAQALPSAPADQTRDLKPADWIHESFTLAQSQVYVDPIDIGDGPFTLTAAYRANSRNVANKQIALAGARLANLLNANIVTHQ
jgi:S1/P1 Nuclease